MRLKISPADKWFSLKIRHRDDFTCQRCLSQYENSENMLDCSHYESRRKKSVRFDEENAVTLCKKCHLFFDGNTWLGIPSHKEEHREFFLKRLGKKRLEALEARAAVPISHMSLDEIGLAIAFKMQVEEMKKKRMETKVT